MKTSDVADALDRTAYQLFRGVMLRGLAKRPYACESLDWVEPPAKSPREVVAEVLAPHKPAWPRRGSAGGMVVGLLAMLVPHEVSPC